MLRGLRLEGTVARNVTSEIEDIRKLQRVANQLALGEAPFAIDGIPDEPLIRSIAAFQKDAGLKVDGIVRPGGETEDALDQALVAQAARSRQSRRAIEAASPEARDRATRPTLGSGQRPDRRPTPAPTSDSPPVDLLRARREDFALPPDDGLRKEAASAARPGGAFNMIDGERLSLPPESAVPASRDGEGAEFTDEGSRDRGARKSFEGGPGEQFEELSQREADARERRRVARFRTDAAAFEENTGIPTRVSENGAFVVLEHPDSASAVELDRETASAVFDLEEADERIRLMADIRSGGADPAGLEARARSLLVKQLGGAENVGSFVVGPGNPANVRAISEIAAALKQGNVSPDQVRRELGLLIEKAITDMVKQRSGSLGTVREQVKIIFGNETIVADFVIDPTSGPFLKILKTGEKIRFEDLPEGAIIGEIKSGKSTRNKNKRAFFKFLKPLNKESQNLLLRGKLSDVPEKEVRKALQKLGLTIPEVPPERIEGLWRDLASRFQPDVSFALFFNVFVRALLAEQRAAGAAKGSA